MELHEGENLFNVKPSIILSFYVVLTKNKVPKWNQTSVECEEISDEVHIYHIPFP